MKFNIKFLKKKYWVIACLLLVIFLLFLVYYYSINDYCEGAATAGAVKTGNTTTASATVKTGNQECKLKPTSEQEKYDTAYNKNKNCGPSGNAYLCMKGLSNDSTINQLTSNNAPKNMLDSYSLPAGPNYKYNTNNDKTYCKNVNSIISYLSLNTCNVDNAQANYGIKSCK